MIGELFTGILITQTGTWGVKYMIKVFSKRLLRGLEDNTSIKIHGEGHFINEGTLDKNISFAIYFYRGYPNSVSIKYIEYVVYHEGKIVQTKYHHDIDVSGSKWNRANDKRINVKYYTASSGLPASNDKWKIEGEAHFESLYGRFTKKFSSSDNLVIKSDTDWSELRGIIQNDN